MEELFYRIKDGFLSFFHSEKKYFSIEEVHNNYFILRHGHTKYTDELTDQIYPEAAHFNLGITKKGKKDIRKIIPKLKNKKIDLIVSSDFLRTQMTAKIIAEELNLKVNLEKRLRDIDLGIYKGKSKDKYYENISPEEMFKKGVEEGESWLNCIKRLEETIKDLEEKYENKNILIISHGDPLWLLDKGIAQKTPIDKLLKERKIIKPGQLKELKFKE